MQFFQKNTTPKDLTGAIPSVQSLEPDTKSNSFSDLNTNFLMKRERVTPEKRAKKRRRRTIFSIKELKNDDALSSPQKATHEGNFDGTGENEYLNIPKSQPFGNEKKRNNHRTRAFRLGNPHKKPKKPKSQKPKKPKHPKKQKPKKGKQRFRRIQRTPKKPKTALPKKPKQPKKQKPKKGKSNKHRFNSRRGLNQRTSTRLLKHRINNLYDMNETLVGQMGSSKFSNEKIGISDHILSFLEKIDKLDNYSLNHPTNGVLRDFSKIQKEYNLLEEKVKTNE